MAIESREKTLRSGETTLLHVARFQRVRLKLTGISGEFTQIPFRTSAKGLFGRSLGNVPTGFFDASEVFLSRLQTFPSAAIYATTPDGVAALDIVYEVRTGSDA